MEVMDEVIVTFSSFHQLRSSLWVCVDWNTPSQGLQCPVEFNLLSKEIKIDKNGDVKTPGSIISNSIHHRCAYLSFGIIQWDGWLYNIDSTWYPQDLTLLPNSFLLFKYLLIYETFTSNPVIKGEFWDM